MDGSYFSCDTWIEGVFLLGRLSQLCHRESHNGPGSETNVSSQSKALQVSIKWSTKTRDSNHPSFQGVEPYPQRDVVPGRKLLCQCDLWRLHPHNFPNGHLKVSIIRPPFSDHQDWLATIRRVVNNPLLVVIISIYAGYSLFCDEPRGSGNCLGTSCRLINNGPVTTANMS